MTVEAERGKARHHVKRSPIGASPGTLIADPGALPSRLRAIGISPKGIKRYDSVEIADIEGLRAEWPLLWLDCVGLGDATMIGEVGAIFCLHRLALEDVVNTGQRPKADFFDDHVFVVLKMIDDATPPESRPEQLSLFFGQGFVITFQENEGDCFDPVRERLQAGGRIVQRGADYLAYALLDAIVDGYFPLLDRKSDRIDQLEDAMLVNADKSQTHELHALRREAIVAKRWLWPVRDAISALIRADNSFVAEETKLYLNDTYDHAVRLIEMVETFRDTLTGLIELHLSLQQARTNEVVNLLTIVSTIFIPLTFLAGIWGMNFDPGTSAWNMPELAAPYGYPIALGLMAVIGLLLVIYFRWKKWL
jgi:magnesium transporter